MRTISFSGLAIAVALAVFVLIPHAAGAMNTTVNITDTAYIGKLIDIIPGDTVTWVNAGTTNHTVSADNGSFGSGTLTPGATYSQIFSAVGSYPYHNGFNPAMTGTVRVVTQTPVPSSSPVPVQTVTTSNTINTTSNAAQAQALYAQVLQLQQTLAALQAKQQTGVVVSGAVTPSVTTGAIGACPRIGRVLQPGMSGDDVARLQQFLAADKSVYPEGQASGYYGVLTQAAVQRWQIKNNIVSNGTPDSTGFGMVGPRTAAAIALQCGSGTTTGSGTTGPVGGFIQVSPVSGVAPLQVAVQATVNTVESCQAATYSLDWGDNTMPVAIPVSANTCSTLQQTYTHTYHYGGQYVVKLSAGGHESIATVTVSGPARPAGANNFGGLSVTAPIGGQTFTSGQTISIAWQSDTSVPAGGSIVLDLYTGDGRRVASNDVIAITSFPAGQLAWTIPFGGGVCPAIYPGKLCGVSIPTGSYKIVARMYQTGSGTTGVITAEASSGIFTIIGANASGEDTFSANVKSGPTPLTVTFAGKLTSGNKAWCSTGCFNLLQFGDGAAEFLALPTAPGTAQSYSVSHKYNATGVYTARLYQSTDTSGPLVGDAITITVGNAGQNFTYGPLELGPGTAGTPLSFTATFDLPTSCTGYSIDWGDNTAALSQSHSTSCASTPVVKSLTHTYAAVGTYTVSLSRGASLDRKDTVGVTVTN